MKSGTQDGNPLTAPNLRTNLEREYAMKEEWISSFLAPATLVWQMELGQPLELVGAQMVSSHYSTDDITAIVGVSGRLEGKVLYGFSEETARSIITVMLSDDADEVSDDVGLSAIAEIANMITGNAATKLAESGYVCDISRPVIIEPVGTRLTTIGTSQMLVSFDSPVGSLTVRISLYEKRD